MSPPPLHGRMLLSSCSRFATSSGRAALVHDPLWCAVERSRSAGKPGTPLEHRTTVCPLSTRQINATPLPPARSRTPPRLESRIIQPDRKLPEPIRTGLSGSGASIPEAYSGACLHSGTNMVRDRTPLLFRGHPERSSHLACSIAPPFTIFRFDPNARPAVVRPKPAAPSRPAARRPPSPTSS